jgi:hypothetical protein
MHGSVAGRTLRTAVMLLVSLLGVAACGNASSAGKVTSPPAATSTATATATPALVAPALCGTDGGSPITASGAGPHDVVHASRFMRLPDEWTLAPHPFPAGTQYPEVTIGNGVFLPIYRSIGAATQPGIICGVTVRVMSFVPLSGPVPNVYHECVDEVYFDPGGFDRSTSCPATSAPTGEGYVALASASAGSVATASVNAFLLGSGADPNHPAQIPNDMNGRLLVYLAISVGVPMPGTYTLEIRLWQDRSGPTVTLPDETDTVLFKQALHEWGGQPCTALDMQAQLPPPTDPPTQLICPGPPPQ